VWKSLLLPTRGVGDIGAWMGDYTTYVEDREHFERYFGFLNVPFQSHLGAMVLNVLDRALGRTSESPARAFEWLSRLAGVAFLVELWVVAAINRWSPRAIRYSALAMAAPASLMYFGFRDLGYLALSAAVFPLFVWAHEPADRLTSAVRSGIAGAIQGIRTALHGFGLLALAGLVLAAATGRRGSRVVNTWSVAASGVTLYLGWVLLYIVGMHLPITPGHTADLRLRRLTHIYGADHRIVAPVTSPEGWRDIGMEALIAGVAVLVMGLWLARRESEARLAAVFALPGLAFLVAYWPTQGLALEMDLVVALFPAVFAGAWLCARNTTGTLAAFALFAAGHVAFWFVVSHAAFITPIV
jgi:hypothetical protein